ncbi:MAG TPA: DUF190 domain-containing protein, partial [Leptolyngbyaceae cyanobacterium M65_K2018_010]|nr:DUF190 domain-containing protein [Leptolyngbyaceae cyanobacterium M65_K2018_010]
MDPAAQLTLYVAEGDRVPPSQPHAQGQLLYQALIEAAQQTGLVGVTVMRSAVSYSQRYPHICVDWIMEFAPHQIVVLTLIDQPAVIARYLPRVKALIHAGLATQDAVTVVHHAPLSSELTSSVPVPQ